MLKCSHKDADASSTEQSSLITTITAATIDTATICGCTYTSATTMDCTSTLTSATNEQKIKEMNVSECVNLLQHVRNRQKVSERSVRRFTSAQARLRYLLNVPQDASSVPQPCEVPKVECVPVLDSVTSAFENELSETASLQNTVSKRETRSTGQSKQLSCRNPFPEFEQLEAAHNTSMTLELPDLLMENDSLDMEPLMIHQPHYRDRPLPLKPPTQPLGPRATFALAPLMSIRIREPALSLAFDPIGRRLISSEPTRGIRFRSVTQAGDDMSPPDCITLDWSLWARAVCVLSCGYLLVATPSNVQLFQADGSRVAISKSLPGVVGLAAYDRSVLAIESWHNNVFVLELPHLTFRVHHPLNGRGLENSKSRPTAMCALRNLVAIARDRDNLLTYEIETGRMRQSLCISTRAGPKELASCNLYGLLFISAFADRRIHILQLKGSILEKVGSLKDPGIKPGPIAWMPINGVLFCAGSRINDSRSCEIRSFALHEAERTAWTPRSIRLAGI